jgi:serine/threonine protein kinase
MLDSGTRLGAYEIVSLVARGGMGEVYRARDLRLDRYVAIRTFAISRPPICEPTCAG